MYYIYPHTDSKILKLGIKWALYREKEPEENYTTYTFGQVYDDIKLWLQSRIAYLKEPEFKVGEMVMYFPKEPLELRPHQLKEESLVVEVLEVLKTRIHYYDAWSGGKKSRPIEMFSHYYEGQQVESFKYVRLIKGTYCVECGNITILLINGLYQCQLCERIVPKKETISSEWQEVEEPEEYRPKKVFDSTIMEANPKYTQFKKELKSGVILLEVITKE